MKILKIKNAEVEDFLGNNFSSPTHWPDWNLLVEKYFHTEFYYLGAKDHGKVIGICPVHKTRYNKFLDRMQSGQFRLIPNGGWIFSEPQILSRKHFPTTWNSAFQSFSLPKVKEFNVEVGNNLGQEKKTLIIDLEKALDEIWQQDIHSKRRNMIRKSLQEGIRIEQVQTEGHLKDFYDLYLEASRRFSAHPISYEFFHEMFFSSPNIQLDIWSAYDDGRQLANVAVISDKNYSIYWLGNHASETRNLGQGELLQWHAIQKMKEKGCKYYDLCYVEPEKLPDIYKFKKGFSKTEMKVTLVIKKPVSFKIINKISEKLN